MAHPPATVLGVTPNLAIPLGGEPERAAEQPADAAVPPLEGADLCAWSPGQPVEPVAAGDSAAALPPTDSCPSLYTPAPAPSPLQPAGLAMRLWEPPMVYPAGSAAATDAGIRRDRNEDTLFANDNLGLYIVADGMGGHAAGDVASNIAVTTVVEHVRDHRDPPNVNEMLTAAIQAAHQAIRGEAKADAAKSGMGTTIVVLYLRGTIAYLAHVGDSRIYWLRQGHLLQLTRDHTVLQALIDLGLACAQVAKSPYRGALTRSVGHAESAEDDYGDEGDDGDAAAVEVDISVLEVQPGDRFLLCSDGLTNECGHDEIEGILSRHQQSDEAATALIDAANHNGGRDNISVVIVDIATTPSSTPSPP